MTGRIYIIFFIVTVFCSFQAFPMAKRPPVKKADSVKAVTEVRTASGTIAKVNLRKSTLLLETKNNSLLTISIDKASTILTRSNKNIKLSELKKGDYASVMYEVIKGRNIAKLIKLKNGSNISPYDKPRKGW